MKSRKTVWVLLFCLMAGAISGTVYKNSRQEKDIETAAASDSAAIGKEQAESGQIQADAGVKADEEEKTDTKETADTEEKTNTEEKQNLAEENTDQNVSADSGTDSEAAPAASIIKTENLDFLTESKLGWPVEGEVLLEFNMDETVYFPTLNLYQCSQGMVIQSEEGTPVCAPAEGVIVSIGLDEQIGNYLVMDVGDGYQVKMGQLKDIEASEGTQVKKGDLLAYIASPTKYYSVEGDNLYLEVTDNGTPVDPLDYLKY